MKLWMLFAVGAGTCWGIYGSTLHIGQAQLGSAMKALLGVGLAYFVIAVMGPTAFMATQTDSGAFTTKGLLAAMGAGALGAGGALCIIFAFRNGGIPMYVMPIVFGGAPVVNVLVSMMIHPPKAAPNPLMWVGMALVTGGIFLVLRFKPS